MAKVTAAVFAIGNEVLSGAIVDTNSAWISRLAVQQGISVQEIRALPDDIDTLSEELRRSSQSYDLILTTGGLGPTFDDLTAAAVSKACGVELQFHEQVFASISSILEKKKISVKESHRRQAFLPAGAILFPNANGTAPGFAVETSTGLIICMPGVPYEMKPMFSEHVLPFLQQRFSLQPRYHEIVRFAAIPESDVDGVIRLNEPPPGVDTIINASKGEILVRLAGFDEAAVAGYAGKLASILDKAFVGYQQDTLASVLVRLLAERSETIAVAESCTGGMLGQYLTEVAGSSVVFRGGLIVYSNWAKEHFLQVPRSVLDGPGPVSEECAGLLVENLCTSFGTEAGLAITGLAGPGGGSPELPVGTVFIGVSYHGAVRVHHFLFPGDRESIRTRSVKSSLKELIGMIRSSP